MTQNKIGSYFLRFSVVRLVRYFLYTKIKYLYSLFFIVLIIVFGCIFFNQNIKNKLVKYYFDLINSEEDLHNKINVVGTSHANSDDIVLIVRKSNPQSDSDIDNLKKDIEKLPWINEVTITRSLPNNLNILIKEYEPFAIWQDENGRYLISKDGKIIAKDESDGQFDHLIILTGEDANFNVISLFNILAIDPEVSKNIYSATWIGSRRWDIRFENNLLVKLPENNIKDAWRRLVKVYKIPGFLLNLNSIDLRIDKKVYLEYNDKTTTEIKSL